MDTNAIASASTSMASSRTQDAVRTTVLKKSMDIERQSAAAIINSVSGTSGNVASPYPISNVGQNINTTA
ncbi:conserved hypothetical protein [Gammaproteobacteria bacterium]